MLSREIPKNKIPKTNSKNFRSKTWVLGLSLSTEKSSSGAGGMNLAIKEKLIEKIEQSSESTLQEVLDFLLFLEFK